MSMDDVTRFPEGPRPQNVIGKFVSCSFTIFLLYSLFTGKLLVQPHDNPLMLTTPPCLIRM
jgi:hypothetical protein